MPAHGQRHLLGADEALLGLDADDAAVLDAEAGHLAILDDVDAALVGRAGIAPGHRVVPHRAAARLQQPAADRKARIVEIDERHQRAHLLAVEQLGIDAVQPHGVAAPRIGVALRVGVEQVQHAALADHGVVVEVLLEPLPQLHRPFVERQVAGQQIVGADDGGVAPDIAGADIALLDHRDIGDAVLLGEIMGGGEPMPAAADDHHVVVRLRLRLAPDRLPVAVAGDRVGEEAAEPNSAWARSCAVGAQLRLTFRAACLTFCAMAAKRTVPRATDSGPAPQATPQTVGFLLVPGFALMSYAAAVEPLRAANLLSGKELYRWWHAAPGGKPVTASNGVAIIPDCGTSTEREADMVFVCAGGNPATVRRQIHVRLAPAPGAQEASPSAASPAVLTCSPRPVCSMSAAPRCIGSICPAFREAFPDVAVVPSLFEIDGNRITCSGGISALDMMVALIERDHGRQLAAAVGDWFLHTHIREGFGPQRMDLRYRLGVADEKLLACCAPWRASIETPQPRAALARHCRHLAPPARAAVPPPCRPRHPLSLPLARLERARQLLRETTLPVLDVALATGFASASQFARAYARAFGEPPSRTRLRG